jgi:hypothetical protein
MSKLNYSRPLFKTQNKQVETLVTEKQDNRIFNLPICGRCENENFPIIRILPRNHKANKIRFDCRNCGRFLKWTSKDEAVYIQKKYMNINGTGFFT